MKQFFKGAQAGGRTWDLLVFVYFLSLKQRLRPLGYCAPHNQEVCFYIYPFVVHSKLHPQLSIYFLRKPSYMLHRREGPSFKKKRMKGRMREMIQTPDLQITRGLLYRCATNIGHCSGQTLTDKLNMKGLWRKQPEKELKVAAVKKFTTPKKPTLQKFF